MLFEIVVFYGGTKHRIMLKSLERKFLSISLLLDPDRSLNTDPNPSRRAKPLRIYADPDPQHWTQKQLGIRNGRSPWLPDVPRPLHAAVLDIVLVAPLAAVLRLRPLVVHVQQGQMVAARGEEILPRCVRVDHLYSSRKR